MSKEGNLTVKLNNEAMNMQEPFMNRDRDLIKSYYKATEYVIKSIQKKIHKDLIRLYFYSVTH